MSSRRVIRLSLLAALCLLLGAATTVGVAWAAELHEWPYRNGPTTDTHDWPSWAPPDETKSYSSDTSRTSRVDFWNGTHGTAALQRNCGWPFLALWRGESNESSFDWFDAKPGAAFISRREVVAIIVEHQRAWPWRYCEFETSSGLLHLSVSPLWAGFAGDTALYAAIAALFISTRALVRLARRRSRASRGMCATCAYDLKGSPTGACPECGRPPGAKA